MSKEITKCWECGCIFVGDNPYNDWFECSLCGTTYKKREETGLWYDIDTYEDKFDLQDMYKEEFERSMRFDGGYILGWWYQQKWLRVKRYDKERCEQR